MSAAATGTSAIQPLQPDVHHGEEKGGASVASSSSPASSSASSAAGDGSAAASSRPASFFDLRVAVVGNVDSGKCFARGTQLRLFDGRLVAAEAVVAGLQLMGDDSSPRTVTAGSLTAGCGTLYRISPDWAGAKPFTVNGAHILVVRVNLKPDWHRADLERGGVIVPSWEARWYEVEPSINMLRWRSRRFPSQAAAQAECAQQRATWAPIEWEVSVTDFLRMAEHQRPHCLLFSSPAVTFQPGLLSLQQLLTVILQQQPTPAQLDWAAWGLGLWLADGATGKDWISERGPGAGQPGSHWRIVARLLQYQQLFGEAVHRVCDQLCTAGHWSYWFKFGVGPVSSVFRRLLLAYGILHVKSVPHALLCDTIDVRRRVLAGIIDGDGQYSEDENSYEVSGEKLVVVDGYKTLAASLGLRNSVISDKVAQLDDGTQWTGHRVHLTGQMWDVVQHCATAHKRCPQPETAAYVDLQEDLSCYGFTIARLPVGEYFGFAVHGGPNRRLLLEDFTVTHNVSRPVSTHSSEQLCHLSTALTPASPVC